MTVKAESLSQNLNLWSLRANRDPHRPDQPLHYPSRNVKNHPVFIRKNSDGIFQIERPSRFRLWKMKKENQKSSDLNLQAVLREIGVYRPVTLFEKFIEFGRYFALGLEASVHYYQTNSLAEDE